MSSASPDPAVPRPDDTDARDPALLRRRFARHRQLPADPSRGPTSAMGSRNPLRARGRGRRLWPLLGRHHGRLALRPPRSPRTRLPDSTPFFLLRRRRPVGSGSRTPPHRDASHNFDERTDSHPRRGNCVLHRPARPPRRRGARATVALTCVFSGAFDARRSRRTSRSSCSSRSICSSSRASSGTKPLGTSPPPFPSPRSLEPPRAPLLWPRNPKSRRCEKLVTASVSSNSSTLNLSSAASPCSSAQWPSASSASSSLVSRVRPTSTHCPSSTSSCGSPSSKRSPAHRRPCFSWLVDKPLSRTIASESA